MPAVVQRRRAPAALPPADRAASADLTAAPDLAARAATELGLPGLLEPVMVFDAAPSPMAPEFEGELCVVWTADGECYAKRPHATATPGRYDLVSFFDDVLADREIVAVARVHTILPRNIAATIGNKIVLPQEVFNRRKRRPRS